MIPALLKQSSACNACVGAREPGREINNREVRQVVSRQVGKVFRCQPNMEKSTNRSSNNSTSAGIEGYGGIETTPQILFKLKKGK